MDLLADVLRQSGLKKRVLHSRALPAGAALRFPCNKSIGFHVVTHGTAWLHSDELGQPVSLRKGDIALMARGCDHVVGTRAELPATIWSMGEEWLGDGPGELALVSGAYQIWHAPVHPFFAELPAWYLLRGDDVDAFAPVQMAISLLAAEVAQPRVGAETVTQALLDVIFTHIVRRILDERGEDGQGWGQGLRDAPVRAALELMHDDCARDWTLESLAAKVGLSRSGFALKFRNALGAPPLQYLTTLRVQKAMELLTTTDDKIESVALAVGYQDAFSFSKVFKKVAGVPPRQFRLADRADRDSAWRYQ